MNVRPILFSAPMIQALIAGRKTQTRRIVKFDGLLDFTRGADGFWHFQTAGGVTVVPCPYGAPGDLLYARETCRAEELSRPQQARVATRLERQRLGRTTVVQLDELDGCDGVRFLADGHWQKIENTREAAEAWSDLYHYRGAGKEGLGDTVPSNHMPRWASRLTLEITDVRVEWLQDCSWDDAIAEGLETSPDDPALWLEYGTPTWDDKGVWLEDPRRSYRSLWEHINGKGSWGANPWVWAVSFRVHQQNVDAYLAMVALREAEKVTV